MQAKKLVKPETIVYNAPVVYRESGYYFRRLELVDKAIAAFHEALNYSKDDIRLLQGLSEACSDAGRTSEAITFAEAALALNPNYMSAYKTLSRAMYTICQFEKALVVNYYGASKRTQPPYFSEGIRQGIQTLEDSIGANAGNVLLEFLPKISQNLSKEKYDEDEIYKPAKKRHVSRIPQPEIHKSETYYERRGREVLARVLAMKYLGSMAHDKFFVQKLLKDLRIKSANIKGSKEIQAQIEKILNTLTEMQEMLREQHPYYSIKLAEKTSSKHQKDFKHQLLLRERKINTRTSDMYLSRILKYVEHYQIKDMLTTANHFQKFLDTKSKHTLPLIDKVTSKLYSLIGMGYLKQYRISSRMSNFSTKNRVYFLMGLKSHRPRSYDSVIGNFPYKFTDYKVAIAKTLDDLNLTENAMRKCFLYYELSGLFNKQKIFSYSKFYAQQCQKLATKIDSPTWWLNSCMMLMSDDIQQGNINDVRVQIHQALESNIPGALCTFLHKVSELLEETAVNVSEREIIEQRQKGILNVIGDRDVRDGTSLLFKQISSVPTGRQFNVLPRPRAPWARTPPERRKYQQLGLTVVAGPPKVIPEVKKAVIPGLQITDML